jgi:hypothetical protein
MDNKVYEPDHKIFEHHMLNNNENIYYTLNIFGFSIFNFMCFSKT